MSSPQPANENFDEKFSSQSSNHTLYIHTHQPDDNSNINNSANLAPPGAGGDPLSPSDTREAASRLNDDLELIRAERAVSHQDQDGRRPRSHRGDSITEVPFIELDKPSAAASLGKDTDAKLYRFWMWLRKFPRLIRYIIYMLPGAGALLAPVLLGYYRFTAAPIGGANGVLLMWFGIWLEVVWCGLWVSRILTSFMPPIFGGCAKLAGSYSFKKWKDIGRQLELHTSLFIWLLGILVSFRPVLEDHRRVTDPDNPPNLEWTRVLYRVIISLFVLAALNFFEKICLQWIATTFHQRTYATRIANHKLDTENLVRLYEYGKKLLAREDSTWGLSTTAPTSGSRTPMQTFQDNARSAFSKVGVVANKVGHDFIGRKVNPHHPRKVVGELLRSTSSAHTLARLLYRSLVREDRDTVCLEDMLVAFGGNDQEGAEIAFAMFDKDLNNDISMDEFEAVCNEIHLEKKAIGASLKDLDSVVQKLDKVLFVIIAIIAIIVLISIISGSAAAALGSAGTTVLSLAWMLQATAQEFLQSIIFVFVKHPFDVGDRVTVYGNTGSSNKGDDYYVTEVSLLYTEFKKMEGHIVQAPNSLLNTLFILNMRRSNGIADVIELKMRFGTPAHHIEELKERMLDFCLQNKRDYQSRIITEVRSIEEVRSVTVMVVFFHKSNFQNELARLTRHNKFCTELQAQMLEVGIQGPLRTEPGGSREFPMYWANLQGGGAAAAGGSGGGGGGGGDNDAAGSSNPFAPRPSFSGSAGLEAVVPGVAPPASSAAIYQQRQRAASRAAIVPLSDDHYGDFQDVFESRREGGNVARLQSIREQRAPLARVASNGSQGSASGVAPDVIQRVGTGMSETNRGRRLFGRPRSKSKTGRTSGEIV